MFDGDPRNGWWIPVILLALWSASMLRRVDDGRAVADLQQVGALDAPVLVVGNSLARHGVDPARLGRALGLDASTLTLDQAISSDWYAMLRWQVFEAGHRPGLIVLPGVVSAALKHQPDTLGRTDRLLALSREDASVAARLPQVSTGWRRRFDHHRGEVRETILDLPRHAFGRSPEQLQAAYRSVFEREGAVDMRLHRRVIPIVETSPVEGRGPAWGLETSFIPDILQLAADHDARVLFVELPVLPAWTGDRANAEQRAGVMAAFGVAHGGYLDLSSLAVPADAYVDTYHLGPRGRRQVTEALGRALTAPMVRGQAPLPQATRTTASERQAPMLDLASREGQRRARATLGPPLRLGASVVADGRVRVGPPWLGELADLRADGDARARACSPVSVASRGAQLTLATPGHGPIAPGQFVHDPTGVWVAAEAEDALATLAFASSSRCRRGAWVAQGQRWELTVSEAPELLAGAARVEVRGRRVGGGQATLRLAQDGQTVEAPLQPEVWNRVALPRPTEEGLQPLVLGLAVDEGAWWISELRVVSGGTAAAHPSWPLSVVAAGETSGVRLLADARPRIVLTGARRGKVCARRQPLQQGTGALRLDTHWEGTGEPPQLELNWFSADGSLGSAAAALPQGVHPLTPPEGAVTVRPCIRPGGGEGTLEVVELGWAP